MKKDYEGLNLDLIGRTHDLSGWRFNDEEF